MSGLAGLLLGLMLVAAVSTVLSLRSLARIQRDYRRAEAAETVSVTPIVRQYVPRRLRSYRRDEDVLLAKQIIERRRRGRRLLAIVSTAILLCSAGTAAFLFVSAIR